MKKIIFSLVFGMMALAPSSQAYKVYVNGVDTGWHVCFATACKGSLTGDAYGNYHFVTQSACPTAISAQGNWVGGIHGMYEDMNCASSEMPISGPGASYNSSNDTHVSLDSNNKIGFNIDNDRVNCVDLGSHTLSSAAGTSTTPHVHFAESCTYEYVDYEDHYSVSDGITTVNVPL